MRVLGANSPSAEALRARSSVASCSRRPLRIIAAASTGQKQAEGGRLPLWKQVHLIERRPAEAPQASPAVTLAPTGEIQGEHVASASEVAPAPAPLWAAVHSKRKAQEAATPMWLRVRSGREASSPPLGDATSPASTSSAEAALEDPASAPAALSVDPAPEPLWQTVHRDGKRGREPFIWRLAMRKWDTWGPAHEGVVVDASGGASAAAAAAAATLAAPGEVRITHLPDEDASPSPSVAAAEAWAQPVTHTVEEAAAAVEVPLWQRVHRKRRASGSGFIIGGSLQSSSTGSSSSTDGSGKKKGGAAAEEETDWASPLASAAFGISIILLVEFVGRAPPPPVA